MSWKLLAHAVILLNAIFKIVMRQNRRGKNMIHTATTEMNLKKGLHGKVCIFYPVLNFGRRTWIGVKVWCNGISFIFLDNFEAPETDRTTFTNGQRYSNNLPYVAAAPIYNPQYINLDTVAQSVGMFIMSLDIIK